MALDSNCGEGRGPFVAQKSLLRMIEKRLPEGVVGRNEFCLNGCEVNPIAKSECWMERFERSAANARPYSGEDIFRERGCRSL